MPQQKKKSEYEFYQEDKIFEIQRIIMSCKTSDQFESCRKWIYQLNISESWKSYFENKVNLGILNIFFSESELL